MVVGRDYVLAISFDNKPSMVFCERRYSAYAISSSVVGVNALEMGFLIKISHCMLLYLLMKMTVSALWT